MSQSTAVRLNDATRPTVVLVHGAFAESSSWNGVIARLANDGYTVIAAANPLRGLPSDRDAVGSEVVQGVGELGEGTVDSPRAAGARGCRVAAPACFWRAGAAGRGMTTAGRTGRAP